MRPLILTLPTLALAASAWAAPTDTVEFNRDVRGILSENCYACHGFDPTTRKADLRLDTPEGATAEIDGVKAIVPGNLDESEAWQRILSDDPDEMMPPPKSHKTLTAAQKETLKRWIQQGARYQRHWSFEPPQRAPLPEVKEKTWVRNPVDAFVLHGLEEAGLKPAPEADRRTLARRVALDLTGLPPKPELVEAFVNDPASDAYEKLVAKLMASPQWGEHRGRYWLDAARYADTHGLHFDKYREIWPYRDWVINAFNRNQPFDQFTVEQIAGDLLPNPTREQLIATGFHRCNATTNEGGTIDEEILANYANDRVTTTSWVWLGLTANCAACHDHKFDPITTKDFYAMAAFFRNTTQPAKDGNIRDTKPVLYMPAPQDEARFTELPKITAAKRTAKAERRTAATKELEPWLLTAKPEQLEVSPQALALHVPLAEGQGTTLAAQVYGEAAALGSTGAPEWKPGGKLGSAPTFKDGAQVELGDVVSIDRKQPFSVGAWVNLPTEGEESALVAQMDDTKALQGWELYVQKGKYVVRMATRETAAGTMQAVTKNNVVKAGKWQHVLATYDGSGSANGFTLYVDGREQQVVATGAGLRGPTVGRVPVRIGRREVKAPLNGAQVQDVRLYLRELGSSEAKALPVEQSTRAIAALPAEKRNPAQKTALQDFYVEAMDAASIQLVRELELLEAEDAKLKERATVAHIQEEKPGEAVANVLMRGAYDKLGEQVKAATFSALPALPADAPHNRLGLAKWLVAPENPLMARVTVNRFWQEVFGTGLVRTAEDFGSQGERPANPELLDWLAVEFRESGWDVKKLFQLLVTSATYRQAATVTPEKLEKDPQDRLLSRGPRFRMDGEMIRDYALSVSGTLSPRMGGPGTKPYQPENVWEVVGLQTEKYTQDHGENLYRRTVYNFWKRMAPPANMEVFNAPAREVCVVRRERTNTPLQALVTLNDPQFVEAARRLAESALQETGSSSEAIARMARRVLLRPLSLAEMSVVVNTAAELEQSFAKQPQEAAAYLAVGEAKVDPKVPAPQLAALTMVANQLLNLDEALNK